ncbi:UNVERIFIED_CONTAM: hypothetical protein GTU68_003063 [Idotea baltica]|nr:hypothetical protein [Idotea baltica]
MTRKEISYTLFISEKTVKKHLENIFKKLGTSKRTVGLEKNMLAVFLPTNVKYF